MHRHCSKALAPFSNHGMGCWGLEPARNIFSPARYNPVAMFEDTFRDMDQQINQLRREMNSVMGSFPGFDQDSFEQLSFQPRIVMDGENKKYQLNLPVGHFSPENVKVSLKDRVMTIEAKMEEKSEDGNSRVYQEVSRQFMLPENVDVTEVKSILTPEGVLKIEAPLPQQALPEPPKPMEIPIHVE